VKPTDVEISRSLNALSTTLREQRPESFEPQRAEQIVTGAMAGERKMQASATGADSGELRLTEDGTLVAVVKLADGRWTVERKLDAGGSTWALPQPAHAQQQQQDQDQEQGQEQEQG
jgi:hypothetical protein